MPLRRQEKLVLAVSELLAMVEGDKVEMDEEEVAVVVVVVFPRMVTIGTVISPL